MSRIDVSDGGRLAFLVPLAIEDLERSDDPMKLLKGAISTLRSIQAYIGRHADLAAAMNATTVAREVALDELAGVGFLLARLTVLIERTDAEDLRRQFEVIHQENLAIMAAQGAAR